jgi:hypothetical protein
MTQTSEESGLIFTHRSLTVDILGEVVVEVSQKQANINYYELRSTDMLEF